MLIPNAFLYAESGGERHVVVAALDAQRLRELGGLTVHTLDEFGQDDMIAARLPPHEITARCSVRAVKTFGIRKGLVPGDFPIALADALRKEGIQLEVAPDHFIERRRIKNEQELAGIRRAQRAQRRRSTRLANSFAAHRTTARRLLLNKSRRLSTELSPSMTAARTK